MEVAEAVHDGGEPQRRTEAKKLAIARPQAVFDGESKQHQGRIPQEDLLAAGPGNQPLLQRPAHPGLEAGNEPDVVAAEQHDAQEDQEHTTQHKLSPKRGTGQECVQGLRMDPVLQVVQQHQDRRQEKGELDPRESPQPQHVERVAEEGGQGQASDDGGKEAAEDRTPWIKL